MTPQSPCGEGVQNGGGCSSRKRWGRPFSLDNLRLLGWVLENGELVRGIPSSEPLSSEPLSSKPLSSKPLSLEEKFLFLWQTFGGPPLEREFRFSPKRKWRADFCCREAKVLIEIEGGILSRGRHIRPMGFSRDVEKYNAATMGGYALVRFVPAMLSAAPIEQTIAFVQERSMLFDPPPAAWAFSI